MTLKKLFVFFALAVLALPAFAQQKLPAWQTTVYLTNLSSTIRSAMEADERGQTGSVQAVLNAISDVLDTYGYAGGISVDTNGWLVLAPASNTVQSTFDFVGDWLNVTDAGTYLDPGITNDVSLQELVDAINEALAPESLTASQIGINTNGLGGLGLSSTNTAQDALNALNSNRVDSSFVFSPSNTAILTGFYIYQTNANSGMTNSELLQFRVGNLNTNYFKAYTNGSSPHAIAVKVEPPAHGLFMVLSAALEGYTPDVLVLGDEAEFTIKQQAPFGSDVSNQTWYQGSAFSIRNSRVRIQMNYPVALDSNRYFVFSVSVTNRNNVISNANWGAFGYLMGTTASPSDP